MYSRVYIEIGNICNMNCSFCHKTKRQKHQMSFDEFKKVVASLSGVTEYLYFHVMGEPLLHPELCSFIEYASGQGFKCAVTTNGTLLSCVGDALLSSSVYKVNISLHSFEDGSREEYLEYISSCLDFADRASKKGILTVLRLWNRGCDDGRNINTLEMAQNKFPDGEWRHSERGARIRHKLHVEYGERFAWPDMNARDMGEEVFCYGLGDHFGVLCHGTVVPCCLDSEGDIPLGNIFSSPIEEILSSERATKMREGFACRHATEQLCRKCGYARRFK